MSVEIKKFRVNFDEETRVHVRHPFNSTNLVVQLFDPESGDVRNADINVSELTHITIEVDPSFLPGNLDVVILGQVS